MRQLKTIRFLTDSDAASLRHEIGGKGASLYEMYHTLKLPVPLSFTVLVSVFQHYARWRETQPFSNDFRADLFMAVLDLQSATGTLFGSPTDPLIVSVRSGAVRSMPGMMETILNLGLNDAVAEGLATTYGERFAFESYSSLLRAYGTTVLHVDADLFMQARSTLLMSRGEAEGTALSGPTLRALCNVYLQVMEQNGTPFPQTPQLQLIGAIEAVFQSWYSERAVAYRASHGIPENLGTAVTVQAMVYGNLNSKSGTGVVHSCNPNTGDKGIFGDWKVQAQGSQIVDGVERTAPIANMRVWNQQLYKQLLNSVAAIEKHCGKPVEVEFTVEDGILYFLQWRPAQLSVQAVVTYAVSQVARGVISKQQAVAMVPDVSSLVTRTFKQQQLMKTPAILAGTPAVHGAAVGRAAFSEAAAQEYIKRNEPFVLVRSGTSTYDLPLMLKAAAIVTASGGESSHAAVVARDLNIPAVVGCEHLVVEPDHAIAGKIQIKEGDYISVDGTTGNVFLGSLTLVERALTDHEKLFLRWRARFALKEAAPRLRTELAATEKVDVNEALNRFYLLQLMLHRSKSDARFYEEISEERKATHQYLADVFLCYLVVAVAGELRHAIPGNVTLNAAQQAALSKLQKTYGLKMQPAERIDAQQSVLKRLSKQRHAQQAEFLGLAGQVFDGKWQTLMGGPKWANIARTGISYMTGNIGQMAFIDLVFDLQHNMGVFFDKSAMVVCVAHTLRHQLDVKRDAISVSGLRNQLFGWHQNFGNEVEVFYTKGIEKGLW